MSELKLPLQNLAELGVKQKATPDLLTIYEYQPYVIEKFCLLVAKLKLGHLFNWLDKTKQPEKNELVTSGYRDYIPAGGARNSPHFFAVALDIIAPTLAEQVHIGIAALADGFYRVGLYPFKNIVHIDCCDINWQKRYGGKPVWVCDKDNKYHSFNIFHDAVVYAIKISGQEI